MRVYLDHNATSPLRPEVSEVVIAALEMTGNPSSVHWHGRSARLQVERAREAIAELVGAEAEQVIFTSGGTEANNMVVSAGWSFTAVSSIEHDSVLMPAAAGSCPAELIPTTVAGVIDLDALDHCLEGRAKGDPCDRALVSIQLVNNETGAVQPLAEAAAIAHEHGAVVHTDAVQAIGKLPIDMTELGVDLLTISAHKLGGPMGAGALVARRGVDLPPLIIGGGQERRYRAGTENVAGIAGFGKAAECLLADPRWIEQVGELRDLIEDGIRKMTPEAVIIADQADRVANTICMALPGTRAETTVIALDLAGVSVSAGAACSSGKVAESHVLRAMGLDGALSEAAIRISLGWNSTKQDVQGFLDAWKRIAQTNTSTPQNTRANRSVELAV